MFFYCQGKNGNINFVIYDTSMKGVNFGTEFIEQNKKRFPKEYAKYQEFCGKMLISGK